GLCGTGVDIKEEEDEARRVITSTALAHLESLRGNDAPGFAAVYDDISHRYAGRLATLSKESQESDAMSAAELDRYRKLLGEFLRLERKTAVQLRNDGRIKDEVRANSETDWKWR